MFGLDDLAGATLGASMIGGGSNLIGSFLNYQAQREANETNVDLAREARQWNEMMWNKQNEYNTPSAQIERMKAAGLNPALMYSQGNVGNAGSVPSSPVPQVQPVTGLGTGIARAGDMIANTMLQYEHLKQQRAQTELLYAKARKESNTTMTPDQYQEYLQKKFQGMLQSNRLTAAKAEGQETFNDYQPAIRDIQVEQGELSMDAVRLNMNLDIVNYVLRKMATESKIRLTNAQISQIQSTVNLLDQRYDFLDQTNPLQYEKLVKTIANIEQSTKYSKWLQMFNEKKLRWDQEKALVDWIFKGAGLYQNQEKMLLQFMDVFE